MNGNPEHGAGLAELRLIHERHRHAAEEQDPQSVDGNPDPADDDREGQRLADAPGRWHSRKCLGRRGGQKLDRLHKSIEETGLRRILPRYEQHSGRWCCGRRH